ncbi:MAG: hypothetical protein ACQERR_06450 [Pseudomonadota bacterium]
MSEQASLHPSIVAMASLAAGIAANHPSMGRCQYARLQSLGVPEHQIETVIDLARHIRDEAAEKHDEMFAAEVGDHAKPDAASGGGCCAPSPASGGSCC